MVCLLVAIITYANPNSIVGVNEVEAVVSGSTFRLRNILCLRSCRHKRFDCIRPVEYPPMIAQAIIIIITTTVITNIITILLITAFQQITTCYLLY